MSQTTEPQPGASLPAGLVIDVPAGWGYERRDEMAILLVPSAPPFVSNLVISDVPTGEADPFFGLDTTPGTVLLSHTQIGGELDVTEVCFGYIGNGRPMTVQRRVYRPAGRQPLIVTASMPAHRSLEDIAKIEPVLATIREARS